MQGRVALPRQGRTHWAAVVRSDVRWLLAWFAVFVAAIVMLLGAHQLYRLTGPHPEITVFIRRLKHHARWLIPGLKGPKSSLLPAPFAPPPPHYASPSRASGQLPQRANA
jgi:hypothetical protein